MYSAPYSESGNPLPALKRKLGVEGDESDELLWQLIRDAENFILTYTKREKSQWLAIFNSAVTRIAAHEYGKLGAEGLKSRTEGGVSTAFEDVPESVYVWLKPHRLVKGF